MTAPTNPDTLQTVRLDGRELALYQAGAVAGRIDALQQAARKLRDVGVQAGAEVDKAIGTKKKNRAAGDVIKAWMRGVFDGLASQLEEQAELQRKGLAQYLDAAMAPKLQGKIEKTRGILGRLRGGGTWPTSER